MYIMVNHGIAQPCQFVFYIIGVMNHCRNHLKLGLCVAGDIDLMEQLPFFPIETMDWLIPTILLGVIFIGSLIWLNYFCTTGQCTFTW